MIDSGEREAGEDRGPRRGGYFAAAHRLSGYVVPHGERAEPGAIEASCACGWKAGRVLELAEARGAFAEHRRSGSCSFASSVRVRTKHDPATVERLLDRVRAGESIRSAAKVVGVHPRTASRLVRLARDRGDL